MKPDIWPLLGFPAGILICALCSHDYPYTHTTRVENVGILQETIWRTANGKKCGGAWQEYSQPDVWFAYTDSVFGPERDFAPKEAAYRAVEWWCRQ
jgi:hypothetical protein